MQTNKIHKKNVSNDICFSGVYAAAHDSGVPWIIIKGVSDFADGKKTETNSWRPFASAMAASVVAHLLSDAIVFKDWPNYERK